jgi:hypothetical protein
MSAKIETKHFQRINSLDLKFKENNPNDSTLPKLKNNALKLDGFSLAYLKNSILFKNWNEENFIEFISNGFVCLKHSK